MTKWHLRDATNGTKCGRVNADLVVDSADFFGRIASDRCQDCERIAKRSAFPPPKAGGTVRTDDVATFLRRERNSLHYGDANKQGSRIASFTAGYSMAIDGLTARFCREFRTVEGFDESRFMALVEGKIQ